MAGELERIHGIIDKLREPWTVATPTGELLDEMVTLTALVDSARQDAELTESRVCRNMSELSQATRSLMDHNIKMRSQLSFIARTCDGFGDSALQKLSYIYNEVKEYHDR